MSRSGVNLSASFVPQPLLTGAAWPLYVYGDSFTVLPGLRCTAGQEYPNLARTALAAAAMTTYGIGETRIVDVAQALRATSANSGLATPVAGALWPGTSSRPGVVVIDAETNDIGHYATVATAAQPAVITTANTKYKDGIASCYRAALALASSESRIEQTAATFGGTWTNTAFAGTGSSGGSIAYTTSAGATATFTVTPPQSGPLAGKVFVLIATLDASVGAMAALTWAIDGGATTGYTPTAWEQYVGQTSAQVNQVPNVITISGIPCDGAAHTVTVTHAGSAGQYLYVDCVIVPSETPNPIVVMEAPAPLAAGTAPAFTAAGLNAWRQNAALLRPTIKAVVAEFPHAVWAPSTITSNGLSSVDGLHPNDRGMQQRTNDLLQAVRTVLPRVQNRTLQQTADAAFATV